MKKRIRFVALLVPSLAAVLFLGAAWKLAKQSVAYEKINQQFGVVMVNLEDGKRFVSFAFRAQQKPALPETPEFLDALASIKDLPDVRGVHLDSLPITAQSLKALEGVAALEQVTIRNCGLLSNAWLPFQEKRPQVKILDSY